MKKLKNETIGCESFEAFTYGQSITDFAERRAATKVETPVLLPEGAEVSTETELKLYYIIPE